MSEKKILAVDDNAAFLETIKDILELRGFEVRTLTDPTKTEEYIEKYKPDLLVMDVFMPKRSGFNILEDFRERKVYQNLPKVFLTCLDDDVEKMTAKACGVMCYITKPFEPEELVDCINMIFKNKKGKC